MRRAFVRRAGRACLRLVEPLAQRRELPRQRFDLRLQPLDFRLALVLLSRLHLGAPSLGHRLWLRNRPGAKLDAQKNQGILKLLLNDQDFREFGYQLSRAMGLAKNSAFGITVTEPFTVKSISL